jgi:hypothetical protein
MVNPVLFYLYKKGSTLNDNFAAKSAPGLSICVSAVNDLALGELPFGELYKLLLY